MDNPWVSLMLRLHDNAAGGLILVHYEINKYILGRFYSFNVDMLK